VAETLEEFGVVICEVHYRFYTRNN
jgi:hypothetical protein